MIRFMEKTIIAFAGPSGVGKSTLSRMLFKKYPNFFSFAISATTRPIRKGEEDGREYYFLSEEEFKSRIKEQFFIEWEEVYPGRFYGTPLSEYERIRDQKKKMVVDIDVEGALSIKKIFKDQAHIVFVKPESVEALVERLRGRKTDSQQDIKTRIARFEKELSYEDQFDSVLVNKTGDLAGSEQQLEEIISRAFPNFSR